MSLSQSKTKAYRAICAFVTFLLLSIITSLYLSYLSGDSFEAKRLGWLKLLMFAMFTSILLGVQFLIAFVVLGRYCSRETIYSANLYYKSPWFPHLHLLIAQVSIYFALTLNTFVLVVFATQFFILLIALLIAHNVFSRCRNKSKQVPKTSVNAEWSALSGSIGDSMGVFTITPTNWLTLALKLYRFLAPFLFFKSKTLSGFEFDILNEFRINFSTEKNK